MDQGGPGEPFDPIPTLQPTGLLALLVLLALVGAAVLRRPA